MSMDVGGGGSSMKSDPNVTPFIDVLLVLLVIFMITVSTSRRVLDIQVPVKTQGPSKPDPNQIILEIKADGSEAINTQPVDTAALGQRLYEIYSVRPDKLRFIKADDSRPYQDVIRAIDVARGAGVQVFGLAPSTAAQAATKAGG